ncbi:DNA sulfur modification protein DndB [Nocardioides montaniterrae]
MSAIKATGYDPYEWFFASRYKQGRRTVYSIDFSVREIITFLPKPDPSKPLDTSSTQRRIYPAHAKEFGVYIRNEIEWVSPSLLLRGPNIFKFEKLNLDVDTGTTQFGQLGIPKDSRTEIQIVDGQHRTLGFHLAWEQLNDEIQKARANLATAKQSQEPALINEFETKLADLIDRRDTLASERVSVQILVVEQPNEARRIFVDINDNAKGITGAVKTRFDDRKVISRALNRVLENNTFLDSKVDLQMDRVTGNSEYLLGAKHVADILRAITVGHGRVTKRLEDELDDVAVAKEFDDFIEAMVEAFPPLADLDNGDLTPAELREESLIGSNVMLRAFAAAWYTLRQDDWTPAEITEAFASFAPHMGPVFPDAKDSWFSTGVFPSNESGTTYPTSRAQDFKTLTDFIVEACDDEYEWFRAEEARG